MSGLVLPGEEDSNSVGGVSGIQDGSNSGDEEDSLRDFFNNQIFVTHDGEKELGLDALGSKSILALYFSASWCPPCREFTPLLAEVHTELIKRQAPFQVIYVPFDKNETDMKQYIEEQHGQWLSIPLGDSGIEQLTERYKIKCVPKLIIVNLDGDIISAKGRKEVQDRGIIAYRSWSSAISVSQQKKAALLDDITTNRQIKSSKPKPDMSLLDRGRSVGSTMAMTMTSQGDFTDPSQVNGNVNMDNMTNLSQALSQTDLDSNFS